MKVRTSYVLFIVLVFTVIACVSLVALIGPNKQERDDKISLNEQGIYKITYDLDGGEIEGSNPSCFSEESDEIILNNPSKEGYEFIGWSGSDIPTLSTSVIANSGPKENKSYVANWRAINYTLTYNLNGGAYPAGVTNPSSYSITSSTFQVNNPVREGYTFLGWSGTGIVGYDSCLNIFNGFIGDRSFTANWIKNEYKIVYDLGGGKIQGAANKYYIDSPELTIPRPTKSGYEFLGWMGDGISPRTPDVTIPTGSTGDRELIAVWSQEETNHTITYVLNGGSNNSLNPATYTVSQVTQTPIELKPPVKEGYKNCYWCLDSQLTEPIYYISSYRGNLTLYAKYTNTDSNKYICGEYPQSIKSSTVSITTTTDSRGYYLGSDGKYYAKVIAKPFAAGYKFSNGVTIQNGNEYYFKVEPIKWKILNNSNGTKFLLSDIVLDIHEYDANINNYASSSIRTWLNGTFYNNSFDSAEKAAIKQNTVSNVASTTGFSPNQYACADTQDKVFLLSFSEVTNTSYGFSQTGYYCGTREVKASDYAIAKGLYLKNNKAPWWLRSPYNNSKITSRYVAPDGLVNSQNYVYIDFYGVRPAIKV